MAWNAPGVMPGGLSSDSYIDRHLRPLDAEHYSAAGLLPYRKGSDGSLEFLFALERPWNSFTKAYDPLGWNIFGGKRIPREERASEATAVRQFEDSVGQARGAPAADVMYRLIANSFAVWYALGKFVLLAVEVTDNDLGADFPDKYADWKKAQGADEFTMTPQGYKKWSKQIDGVEWVKAADLAGKPNKDVSDLLSNILQIDGFQGFLQGGEIPAANSGNKGTKGTGKDKGWNNKGKGGDKGKGWKGDKGKGWNGDNGKGWNGGGKGLPAYGGGMGSFPMAPMPMVQVNQMGMMGQMPFDPNSMEMTRQLYGEQLYLMVQPMAESPYLSQKITGMLLELPNNELMLNLTHPEELRKRVMEALEVLREDGVA